MTRRSRGILGVATMMLVGLSAGVTIGGCSGDDSSPATGTDASTTTDTGTTTDSGGGGKDSGGSTTGSVTGTITYAGAKTGAAIHVSVAASLPPSGPPPASTAITPATFPATYTLSSVPPGTYHVLAYLATGSDHPFGPIPADPQDFPQIGATITVTAGGSITKDLTLVDPVTDGGLGDAGDGGDGG